MNQTRCVVSLGVAGLLLSLGLVSTARASDANPTVSVTPGTARVGDTVVVHLDGWGQGTVVVGVCGNNARRGSDDCALIGDEGVAVRGTDTTLLDLQIVKPPVPCPCVVRAETPSINVVRTAPIQILGVPIGPELVAADGPPLPSQLKVTARVEGAHASWPAAWLPPLAGPTTRTLVLTVHNRGADAVKGLRVVGIVGRDRDTGEPLKVVAIKRLAGGATRTIRVPADLSAPVFGDYTVSGTVYGLESPARFEATTSNDPWGLELAAPLALLAVAQLVRRRERARRREQAAVAAAQETVALLPHCSPSVGGDDGDRFLAPAYDPLRGGCSEVGANGGSRRPQPMPAMQRTAT